MFSSMACTYLTEASMDFVRNQIAELAEHQCDSFDCITASEHGVVDVTERFLPSSKVATTAQGKQYHCCCRLGTEKIDGLIEPWSMDHITCQLVPDTQKKKIWWKWGCGGLMGDGYYEWYDTAEVPELSTYTNSGRCVVQRDIFGKPQDPFNRIYRLTDVVTEKTVLHAFELAFPALNISRTLMRHFEAEKYYSAMQTKFSATKLASTESVTREFVFAGGFVTPDILTAPDGTAWNTIAFAPIQLGEVHAQKGCAYPHSMTHWKQRRNACHQACMEEAQQNNPGILMSDNPQLMDTLQGCAARCQSYYEEAIEQEDKAKQRTSELKGLAGTRVSITSNGTLLNFSSAQAMLPILGDATRTASMSSVGQILTVDPDAGVAEVMTMQANSQPGFYNTEMMFITKFPLEALTPTESTKPIYSPGERTKLSTQPRYGECWSKCRPSFASWNQTLYKVLSATKRAITLGTGTLWCFSAQAASTATPFGMLCTRDDDCGNADEEGSAEPWGCSSECS
jgi:hypothetical protein